MAIFRRAEPNDAQALTQIRLTFFGDALTAPERDRLAECLPRYFAAHIGRDLIAYLAEEDGAIVAGVFLLIAERPAGPAFMSGRTGTILNVYTAPEHRRRGLARTLLEMAIADAREMDVARIDLKATPMGRVVYEKLGFRADAKNLPMTLEI
jgi:GNAT superfamily N-acetyltransferase